MNINTEKLVDELMSDRGKFDEFVYTPLDDAVAQLGTRSGNKEIGSYISKNLPAGIPNIFINKKCAVVFVQIATPNFELRRFISIVDAIEDLMPVFFEFTTDKFTDNNVWKHNLGKMTFFNGRGKKGGEKLERLTIIDFNAYKGKKLCDVKTTWDQSLCDFHHELFDSIYPKGRGKDITFYDASDWFAKSGGHPQYYYESFFKLFLKNGILFENYMLDEKESWFTHNIVLPALIKIREEINIKPLIVNIQPTDIEGQPFWSYHPHESIDFVKNKMQNPI